MYVPSRVCEHEGKILDFGETKGQEAKGILKRKSLGRTTEGNF